MELNTKVITSPIDFHALKRQLTAHEGLRLKPYRDPVGKLTIGVGRNLSDVGISPEEAALLLDHDIQTAIVGLSLRLPWFHALDPVRQMALVDLAFNLGVDGLLTFKRMLSAMQAQRWDEARAELLASKWASQVQAARVQTIARQILTGA